MKINWEKSQLYTQPSAHSNSATCFHFQTKLITVRNHLCSFQTQSLSPTRVRKIFLCTNNRFQINNVSTIIAKMKKQSLSYRNSVILYAHLKFQFELNMENSERVQSVKVTIYECIHMYDRLIYKRWNIFLNYLIQASNIQEHHLREELSQAEGTAYVTPQS